MRTVSFLACSVQSELIMSTDTLALYETLVGGGKFKKDLVEHEKNRKANEAKRQNERGWGDW